MTTKARYLAFSLILLLAFGAVLWGYRSLSLELAIAKERLSESEEANEILRGDFERARVEIADLTEARSALERQLVEKNEELDAANREGASLKSEVGGLNQRLNQLESDAAKLNTSLTKARQDITTLNYSDTRATRVLAVDDVDIAMPIEVEARNGEGLLLDIEGVLIDETVQESMKIAFEVAQDVSGRKLTGRMIIFHLRNPFVGSLTINGESAGAAMTMGLIALAEGRKIKSDVLITGIIRPDGSIASVFQIFQKAVAAKQANATTLLVPVGRVVKVEGIRVIEVTNITEAMGYMLE